MGASRTPARRLKCVLQTSRGSAGGGSPLRPPHRPRLFCVASVCHGRVREPRRRPGRACVSERTLSLTPSLNRPSWPRRSGRSPERYAQGQGSPAGGQQELHPPPPEVPAQSKGRGKGCHQEGSQLFKGDHRTPGLFVIRGQRVCGSEETLEALLRGTVPPCLCVGSTHGLLLPGTCGPRGRAGERLSAHCWGGAGRAGPRLASSWTSAAASPPAGRGARFPPCCQRPPAPNIHVFVPRGPRPGPVASTSAPSHRLTSPDEGTGRPASAGPRPPPASGALCLPPVSTFVTWDWHGRPVPSRALASSLGWAASSPLTASLPRCVSAALVPSGWVWPRSLLWSEWPRGTGPLAGRATAPRYAHLRTQGP